MTAAVQAFLDTFDRLSDADRQEAAVEILRRVTPSEGELPENVSLEAAGALFYTLDSEEVANAGSESASQLGGVRARSASECIPGGILDALACASGSYGAQSPC
jgi:hypothetical protein